MQSRLKFGLVASGLIVCVLMFAMKVVGRNAEPAVDVHREHDPSSVKCVASGSGSASAGDIVAHGNVYGVCAANGTMSASVDALLEGEVYYVHEVSDTAPTVVRLGCPVSSLSGSVPYEVPVYSHAGDRIATVSIAPPSGVTWSALGPGMTLEVGIVVH